MTRNELFAVLNAYREAAKLVLPEVRREMDLEAHDWCRASERELRHDLEVHLLRASDPAFAPRVFFKMGRDFIYGGCNRQFALDAGLSNAADIIGLNDFDPQISWAAQAAKYRKNDRDVMEQGRSMIGIIERQSSASGVIWLDTSKVPIVEDVKAIGVFGIYEIIDDRTAWQRSVDRTKLPPSR